MKSKITSKHNWRLLLITILVWPSWTAHVFGQAISLYAGGVVFPASPLKTNPGQELSNPLVITIDRGIGTNLFAAKDSGVPIKEGYNQYSGGFKQELWTHAAGVTWQFAKAGIEFDADGILYVVQKDGATVTFMKDDVRLDGVARKQDNGKSPATVQPPTNALSEELVGKWIALDNKDHYVLISAGEIRWEKGAADGPDIIPASKWTILPDKHSVTFPVRSDAAALVSGKIVTGTMNVKMTLTGNSLTIAEEGKSTTIKDPASGFSFQQTGGATYKFKKTDAK